MIDDVPLAIVLAFMFVVLSIVRWRWFKARAERGARRPTLPVEDERGEQP